MAEGCSAGFGQMPVAMAYVPRQRFGRVYDLDKALQAGTIFADLDKPFWGKGGGCHERCMQ